MTKNSRIVQSNQKNNQNDKTSAIVSQTILTKSPIPVADEFAKYEQALPGAGQQIIYMAKKQQEIQLNIADKSYFLQRKSINHNTIKFAVAVCGLVAIVAISLLASRGLWYGELIITGALISITFDWGSIIDGVKKIFTKNHQK